jgi:hypothetical protein
MFHLSTLAFLTIFNLIALAHIVAHALAPASLQRPATLGAAAICLATSCTGLAMAMLLPSPVAGTACVTIAALVNLLAVLSTGLDQLSDPTSAEAIRFLGGLARLAIIGAPYEPVRVDSPASDQRSTLISQPHAVRGARYTPFDPLPRLLEAASQRVAPASWLTRPPANAPQRFASTRAPRHNHRVPHRPNRLPTASLAFLLSVSPEESPDIFASSRASMSELPALARRVRLVTTDPRRPLLSPQSTSVWPTTFSEPDPAWRTSYGRFPAIAIGL